jgi:hypothetical protein
MALWGKTDTTDDRPKYVVLKDGVLAQDASGKKLVLIDNEEAALAANKALGVTSAGWYLVQKTDTRTKVELLIALSDAPRGTPAVDDPAEIEADLGLSDPE